MATLFILSAFWSLFVILITEYNRYRKAKNWEKTY